MFLCNGPNTGLHGSVSASIKAGTHIPTQLSGGASDPIIGD